MTASSGQSPAGGDAAGAVIDTPGHLAERLRPHVHPSTVLVCIGSGLRGDDGVGPAIARRLTGAVPWTVYNTQTVPESFLMRIVRARPQSVLLIDALDFGAAAGSVGLLPADRLGGHALCTHGPGAQAFLAALRMLHPCPVAVLGIQPAGLELGEPISAPVAAAADMVIDAFRSLASAIGR